jgi:glycosyltransferase involved in cell wall biosynthesis
MRIAIDAGSAAIPGKTGVAKYIHLLMEHLEKLDDDHEYLVCYRLSRWKRREHFYRPLRETTKVRLFQEPFFSGRGIDVFHGPDARLPKIKSPRLVATIHDLFSLVSDEFADEKFRKKKIARYGDIAERADRIVCVSENTRRDFLRYFPDAEPRTRVVYHGVEERFRPRPEVEVEQVRKRYGIKPNYILYLGELSKRKNLPRMLGAFLKAREKSGEDLQFVAAGKLSYGKEDVLRYIDENRCGDHVLLPGYIAEDDLPALYCGARLFMFTTLYEGFGMPILEALACGTPVLTSNVSSMAEIAPELTTRVDPTDEDEMAEGILRHLSDDHGSGGSIEGARHVMSEYTWSKAAREMLSAYLD